MITEKELQEIRTLLNNAQNPLFLFDDDQDGLCSFLLLWRYAQKGKGIASKGHLEEHVIAKIQEERADLLIILDKATLKQEIVDGLHIPIIHIDHHHPIDTSAPHYHYYNPRKENDADSRPTSYWSYQVAQQDLWIAMVGIISDWYIPEYVDEFNKAYPGLLPEKLSHPGEALFDAEFGKLARAFAFSLKGKSNESKQCIKVLTRIESPWEILRQETARGKFIYKHYEKLEKSYQKLRQEALDVKTKEKVLLFTYPATQDSFTSLLSNELIYRRRDKIIIVGRVKDDRVIMSIRSSEIKLPQLIHTALEGLTGYGGGHYLACGANVKQEDFGTFITRFKKLVAEAKEK